MLIAMLSLVTLPNSKPLVNFDLLPFSPSNVTLENSRLDATILFLKLPVIPPTVGHLPPAPSLLPTAVTVESCTEVSNRYKTPFPLLCASPIIAPEPQSFPSTSRCCILHSCMVTVWLPCQKPRIPPAVLKPLIFVFEFAEVPFTSQLTNSICESVCPVIPLATEP